MAAALTMGEVVAAPVNDDEPGIGYTEQEIIPVTTTYLDNVFSGGGWASNWFVTVQGGVSAFLGTPSGHGDFFDREKLMLNIAAGKWITPTVGGRISMQGFKLFDSFRESRSYMNIHADVLYNVSNLFRKDYGTLPKWDLIPYVGLGLIRNKDLGNNPFAISYGISGRYRLTDRLHVTGEIGNTMTSQCFDGNGENNHFGDHLLQANVGLTVTIGKVGWKRVVDPQPYILQNDLLSEQLRSANDYIHQLKVKRTRDAAALAEMRKILEIEGLLDKYNLNTLGDGSEIKKYPKNNYSGLNSLRARLRGKNFSPETYMYEERDYEPEAWNPNDSTQLDPAQYFKLMKDGKIFVGSPVFFFFKLNSSTLAEKAQEINIREIASVIKKYGLSARVVGAADSQTGAAYTNERLSAKRADYIAKLLRDNGVPENRVEAQYRGGINSYVPMEGNRNTCVMLYFKEKNQ